MIIPVLTVALSAAAVSAAPFYPPDTTVNLDCNAASFDLAGAVSGGASSEYDCKAACKHDALYAYAKMNATTGQVIGLAADKYAGCSFPADYSVTVKASDPCLWTSSFGAGFFMAIDTNAMANKETTKVAVFTVEVELPASETTWMIYKASKAVATCSTMKPTDDSWIDASSGISAYSDDKASNIAGVDLTAFYFANDAEDDGKMYVYMIPQKINEGVIPNPEFPNTVTTVSSGLQFGVSTACGAFTNCAACVESNCHWCQLTVDGVFNGLCGVTEDQCYHQGHFSFGTVGWYLDQCTTAETTSTSTAAPCTPAGAGSTMALSLVGAVVLVGAAVAF